MTPDKEKKVLNAVIRKLDHPAPGVLEKRFFLPTLWIFLAILFAVIFHLMDEKQHRALSS